MRHAGNVRAPDRELALHYAREFYSRRKESVRLWVVPRTEITDIADPDLLQPPLDRSFKKPGGYVLRDKLDEARKRAGQQAGRPRRQMATEARLRDAPADPARPAAIRHVRASIRRLRAAIADLLLTMADDEFVIGFRDSEWTGIAPMLEEDVAFSSIAQDEIGHARLLYEMRGALTGEDADRLAFHRQPQRVPPRAAARSARARAGASPSRGAGCTTRPTRSGWPALAGSSFAPLAEVVAKIRREERYHLMHLDAWLERLGTRHGKPRGKVLSALKQLNAAGQVGVRAAARREQLLVDAGSAVGTHGGPGARWRSEANARLCASRTCARSPSDAACRGRPRSRHPRRVVRLALERVHVGRAARGGRGVVMRGVARGKAVGVGRLGRVCMTSTTPRSRRFPSSTWAWFGGVETGGGQHPRRAAADVRRLSRDRRDARRGRRAPARVRR